MHASSLENLQKCIDRYLDDAFFSGATRRIVDIGSMDVNGSYRSLFRAFDCEYQGFDLQPGPGVDVVLENPYHIPLPDGGTDIVISGQALEHCEFFWEAFREMIRILSPDGYLFLIAPSAGPIHRYPVDCYRFYPDAYHALAKYAGCKVVAVWRDERGPWRDLTGVFSKNPDAIGRPILKRRSRTQNVEPITADPKFEPVSGKARSRDVMRMIHEVAKPRFYLEIGVRRGGSLALASCPTVAVDPEPRLSHAVGPHVSLFETTSDLFFEFDAASALKTHPDLIFIDGMHLFEFVLRDFMNAERHAHAGTILLIDDILPNHPRQASRERQTRVWTGDVWKIEHCLKTHRPDLHLIRLDTSPAGLLMVLGLKPTAVRLWERYNAILRHYQGSEYLDTPQAVLDRDAAHDPNSAALRDLVSSVAAARNPKTATQFVTTAVREFHAKSPALG